VPWLPFQLPPWFGYVEAAYVLALAVWIVLQKRPPLSTLAWVFGLSFLPVVGLFVYPLLGPQRLERRRSKRALALERLRAAMPELASIAADETFDPARDLGDDQRPLVALATRNCDAHVSSGNRVEVLRNGPACFDALEAAILGARHHIHVEYYIFAPDETGRRFRDLLARRASEGVEVRLLVDAVGSWSLSHGFLAPLRHAGAHIRIFNRTTLARLRWNFRNHRTIVVVDGEIGFTGGLNIADDYLGRGPNGLWRDTHLRLEGPAVQALQVVFLEDWSSTRPEEKAFAGRRYFKERTTPPGNDGVVQVVAAGPDRDWQAIQQLFFAAVTRAQRRVLLTTPYFVPDEATLTALQTAALRGVGVHILLPRRTDALVARAAARSYYDELLKAGVRIHEYLPGFLHAKVLVVDGRFASVGSANFDQRSFRLNFELNAHLFDPAVIARLEEAFARDVSLSSEVTLSDREKLPLPSRLGEALARLLSPVL
jgi:cardiolipin synthase